MTYRFVVTGGSRSSVKQYLFGQLPLFSRFALRQATADGACRVDGEIVPASYRLRAGQVVDFTLAPEPQRTILAEELPLEVRLNADKRGQLGLFGPADSTPAPKRGRRRGGR